MAQSTFTVEADQWSEHGYIYRDGLVMQYETDRKEQTHMKFSLQPAVFPVYRLSACRTVAHSRASRGQIMKTLWAFEPFHQDKERLSGMHRLLKQIGASEQDVEAAFLVTHNEPELNKLKDLKNDERYKVRPRAIMAETLAKAGITLDDKNLHVLDYPTRSVSEAVDRILKLARKQKSELIALYTHARHGFKRLIVGSFAETAIHHSRTSLLLVNPQCKVASKVRSVVFASDFSPEADKHAATVLQLCKRLGAKLTILHHAEVTYAWSMDESNPTIIAYRKQVDKTRAALTEKAKKAGVNVEIVINSDFVGTSEFLLQSADKFKADLIVMSAKASPTLALMGGSISRKVVRAAEAPVLILK
jgi:nucleotide-binding universal stress UspA family protein